LIDQKGWKNVICVGSLDEGLKKLNHPMISDVFIIGGKSLFEEGLKR